MPGWLTARVNFAATYVRARKRLRGPTPASASTSSLDAARVPIVTRLVVLPAKPHGIGGSVPRFDFDGLAWFQLVVLHETQKRRILIGDAGDAQRRANGAGEERVELAAGNRPIGIGDRIAVRVVRGMTEHFVDPLDQPFGDDVLELLRFIVDLGPAHTHHLHQKQLHEAMAAQDETRQLLARGGQADPGVGLVLRQAGLRQRLHHGGRRARRNPQRGSDLPHRHESICAGQGRLSLINRFQVILDGARREHGAIISNLRPPCPWPMKSRHLTASANTCARSLRRLPTAMISSPWRCHTARTADGSGG